MKNTFKEFLIAEATAQADASAAEGTSGGGEGITNKARTTLKQGVNRVLRLDAKAKGQSDGDHAARSVDALDMIEAMEVVRKMFDEVKEEGGAAMRKGEKEFDYVDDIKKAIKAYYLEGQTKQEGALKKRQNINMVQQLLYPMVDTFDKVPYDEAMDMYNNVLDETLMMIKRSNVLATAEDAFLVRRMIQKEVARRATTAKAVTGIMKLRQKIAAKAEKKKK